MEDICERLCAAHGLAGYPVDVWRLAAQLGVRVRVAEWGRLPHAVWILEARLILTNARRSEAMRRFDVAHELGHVVLQAERYHGARENRFAACLLMPAREFRLETLAANGDWATVGQMFGVTAAAAARRGKELGWHG